MIDCETLGNAAAAVAAMTVLDIATGVTRAALAGEISSAGWHRGLLRKTSTICCFALAAMLEWVEGLIEIGVHIPLLIPVAAYICVTEATSTYENIRCIDPSMRPKALEGIFAVNAVDDLFDGRGLLRDEEGEDDGREA